MAGETEDCISYQADHLPTGSISFGRFEVETLCWERKSSFCHNRYLEEVEKYSTPGSVTQKRAILEAHFKKKPLFPQYSLDSKSGSECQDTRKGNKSCSNEDKDQEIKPESCWYDDSTSVSDGHESLVFEQVIEVSVPPCNNDERMIDITGQGDHAGNPEDQIMNKDTISEHEPENKTVIMEELGDHDREPEHQISNKDVNSEHEPENKIVIMEELLENKEAIAVEELKNCVQPKCSEADSKKVNTPNKKPQSSHKVKETNEHGFANPKQKDANASQNVRKSSIARNYVSSGKMLSRSIGNQERENVVKSKSVEQAPLRIPRPKSSISRNPKPEVFLSMVAKERQEDTRSEANAKKNVKATKSSPRPHSTSGRREVGGHKCSNRPKHAYNYKEEPRQIGTVFSLKSDERAEQRKQYFMKLEEKLQAKEVEMSKIQAKTKEQTEAAIRQFRKSLNFKANPMPSFYSEAVPKSSERKKKAAVVATERQALLKDKTQMLSRSLNRGTPLNASSKVQKKATAVKNSSGNRGDTGNVLNREMKSEGVAVHGA